MTADNFWALLWGEGGQFHEIYLGGSRYWVPVHRRDILGRMLRADEARVSLVPRSGQHDLSWAASHVLWARLETKQAAERLTRFHVPPTLVIREGRTARRTVLWALSAPLEGTWLTRATERLAYRLKGLRRAASPTNTFPSPFSCVGRSRCWVEYERDGDATARQIVGPLADAPELRDWRKAAA